MKKIFSVFLSGVFLLTPFAMATPVLAATFTLGNDSGPRSIVDTYANFTIIDTNNPATANGEITSFDYYASNVNPFRFVVVDSSNKVTWVSDEIIPSSVGSHSFILTTSAVVSVGDNIGMYFAQTGTIPFEYVGDPAVYTPNNNGLPAVGDTLVVEGTSGRTYSLVANGDDLNCAAIVLVSSTNTQFKGLTYTDPVGSSADSAFTLGTPGPAVVATPVGFPGAWDTAAADPDVAGASWVNDNATPPTNPVGAGGDGSIDSWRLFSDTFLIPAGAVISSADLHFTADNSVEAFLDNVSVGTATSYTTVNDAALSVTPGAHELEFVVKNDAYPGPTNPTGLLYRATVNYCAPVVTTLDCPAAPSIAAAYLKEQDVKAGSSTYKNLISQVAQFMGPQKNFQGKGACDAEYAATVEAFVDTLWP